MDTPRTTQLPDTFHGLLNFLFYRTNIGVLSVFLACIVAGLCGGITVLIAGDPVMPEYRVVVTSVAAIEIPETGDYLIYHEYRTDLPSVHSLTDKPDSNVSVRLRASDSGEEITIQPLSVKGHYEGMGRSGYALGRCVIQTAGVYVVSISQKTGNAQDAIVVAFGREGKVFWFVASLLLGFLVSLPLIWWRIRRLRFPGS